MKRAIAFTTLLFVLVACSTESQVAEVTKIVEVPVEVTRIVTEIVIATPTHSEPPTIGIADTPIEERTPAETPTETPIAEGSLVGKVIRVLSGKQIRVTLLGEGKVVTVEYIGIEIPESLSVEAHNANSDLMTGGMTGEDTILIVEDGIRGGGTSGGVMQRYVYLEDGTFVNHELVLQGLAVVNTSKRPLIEQFEYLKSAELEARNNMRGVWAGPTPTQKPPTPTKTPAPTNTPKPTVNPLTRQRGNGFYLVNIDIAPGLWRSTGTGDKCYWATTNSNGDINDNHYGMSGGTMRIFPSDFQVQFEDCGLWEYLGP
jgi:endonuclease YncB( thermonuclease family)